MKRRGIFSNAVILGMVMLFCALTAGGQQRYSVSQAVSDNAQLHTIAFNALAFFTGDPSSDTFFPPGKVSDFFGFQYFRDVDAGGMGHNTTFVPRVANNILAALNEDQIQKVR